ncbi:MAG TPA: hypothetical protein VNI61_10040, partial [Gemmatimonadales bacterium]|nr:hypothetical protein [Gemmatimonadales bacterium]
MTDALALLLLLASLAGGLVLVPFGLPGLWVMVAGIAIYGWLTDFRAIGAGIIGSALALATAAELLEAWVGFR